MDYKKLAIQIASAEDPYGEFAKEASSLDDTHKTTLAREVNKQFFISRIDGREGDGGIDFNVIQPEIIGTHEKAQTLSDVVEKTASDNSVSTVDKRSLIDSSMYVLAHTNVIKASSSNNSLLNKFAEENNISNMESDDVEEDRIFKNNKARAIAVLNDMFSAEVEGITKIANDASELRAVIGAVIDKGYERIVPEIVIASNDTEATLLKVASVDIDRERQDLLIQSISNLNKYDEIKHMVKIATCEEELEKISFVGKILGNAGATVIGTGARALGKLGKGVAKGVLKSGKFLVKHPSLAAPALTTIGIATQVRPMLDKYEAKSLRI